MDKNKPDYVQEIEKLFGSAIELPPTVYYADNVDINYTDAVFVEYDSKKCSRSVQVKLGEGGQGRNFRMDKK